MLNRLMFIYFIQKKHFLDGDPNYLESRLRETQEKYGGDTFHNRFYRHFLRRLFSEGLGAPPSRRDAELKKMLGKVPYLNGGLFDLHDIEEQNEDIDIKDEAFKKLFDFFGKYNWHLDTRATATGNDINPDVIGYIFEKYINDRAEMGAYYTQEDITGYITRNTVIPFLLQRAKKKCKNAFDAENGIWRFLRENPDNYIYDAVKKGCDLPDEEIPENIRRGMDAKVPDLIQRRQDWNTKAEERFALPTEIWRETMARRTRYFELKTKITNGEIHEIDDLITYNLDIERFASDALRYYEGSDFIAPFYEAIAGRKALQSNQQNTRGITVLDPACGSGAFLFAALNILEPLYEICIDRMREFVEEDNEARAQGKRKGTKKHPQFRAVLEEIESHPNEKYWIYKHIILNNLYGVDLMREAAEIAKLRLFLKLAATAKYDKNKDNLGLEPLPDIDFNIRSGNSLVGFANMAQFEEAVSIEPANRAGRNGFMTKSWWTKRIREQAGKVQKANDAFRAAQDTGSEGYQEAKRELTQQLDELNDGMNHYLAEQYGKQSESDYHQWLQSHQPFHWVTEFYGIVEESGGFDVVVGNPPYVKIATQEYTKFLDMPDFQCPDIYGHFLARAYTLSIRTGSRIGFIVMHNLAFHKKFQEIRDVIKSNSSNVWFSFYGRIPSGLFSGDVRVRNCLFIADRSDAAGHFYTTRLHRWQAKHRDILFPKIEYAKLNSSDVIPMFNDQVETDFFQGAGYSPISKYIAMQGAHSLFFKQVAYNWISVSLEPPPCFNDRGKAIPQTKISKIILNDEETKKILLLLFNGRMFFTHWLIYGDEFDLTSGDLTSFRLPIDKFSIADRGNLLKLADKMAGELGNVIQFKLNAGKKVGSYNTSKLWHITDKSDKIFLKYMTNRPEEVFESIVCHVSQTVLTNKSKQD